MGGTGYGGISGSANLVLDMHLGDRIIGELLFDTATESFAISYRRYISLLRQAVVSALICLLAERQISGETKLFA